MEFFAPFLGAFEARGRIARNEEESPHGMHITEGRLGLGHFEGSDTQTPKVTPRMENNSIIDKPNYA